MEKEKKEEEVEKFGDHPFSTSLQRMTSDHGTKLLITRSKNLEKKEEKEKEEERERRTMRKK